MKLDLDALKALAASLEDQGWSEQDQATRLGISPFRLRQFLAGVAAPKLKQLEAWGRMGGVPLGQLLADGPGELGALIPEPRPATECLAILLAQAIERGYTRRGVAKMLGVSVSTLDNWEGGKRRIPFYAIVDLAFFLEQSLNALVFPVPEANENEQEAA